MTRSKGLTKKQKDQRKAARQNLLNKENIPPQGPRVQASRRGLNGRVYAAEKALKQAETRAEVERRRADANKTLVDEHKTRFRSERRKNQRLSKAVAPLVERATMAETTLEGARKAMRQMEEEMEKMREAHKVATAEFTRQSTQLATTLNLVRKTNRALKAQSHRASKRLQKAVNKARSRPISFQLTHRGAYTPAARALIRAVVEAGCPRNKVGVVISKVGQFLGINVRRSVDRRTVGRAVLEGGVAAKVQLGYEMAVAKSLTLSGDSTSHRKVNFDARHIALRVPDYASGSLEPDENSIPAMRLIGVESSADHSSELARDGWITRLQEAGELFNESPFAKRTPVKFSVRSLVQALKGMNGDHASVEKRTASLIQEWKQEETLLGFGEDKLQALSPLALVQYLVQWSAKKIVEAGGIHIWNGLSEDEKTRRDIALMKEIKLSLGKEEYEQLSDEDKRMVDLFIWAGCCMHKDQNSFKAGNTDIVAWWLSVNKTPPMTLANKENAATLNKILNPSATISSEPITEVELAALEASTRGGAKTAALAGSIFNNKDDKKGQGDIHVYHLSEFNTAFRRFPDTNNTRFGSHGEAAAELITHLDKYLTFLRLIRDKKQRPGFTNIEKNVYNALQDIPTLTELAVMTLYSQAVTHPYMRTVRGPHSKNINVLDLGSFHTRVMEFCQTICDCPEYLASSDATSEMGSLDGKGWERPEAINAVKGLIPLLPDLSGCLVAFFTGALRTWMRFSAEFAPGGLIDLSTVKERELAWMPPTNDVNEGILGAFRVGMRNTPTLTQHQWNAQAMFHYNKTQAFIDAVFDSLDHIYVMRKAREWDSSGMEAKRRKTQVEFDMRIAQIQREKEVAKRRREIATLTGYLDIILFSTQTDLEARNMTVPRLDEQLDLLQNFGGDDQLPKTKKARGLKPEKIKLLGEALLRYEKHVADGGEIIHNAIQRRLAILGLENTEVVADWYEEEEGEMGYEY